MNNQLVISVMAEDRPGVVDKVANLVTEPNGHWLQSALSRLGGKFAGIVLVEVPPDSQQPLETALGGLAASNIRATVEQAGSPTVSGETATFQVLGNDRKGIVGEISRMLARHGVSVDELYTSTESAPMSGDLLFRATANIVIPQHMDRDNLQSILEELSDDLVVEFFDDK